MASRSSEVNFTKNYTLLYLLFLHVIHGRPWLCIVRDCTWSVSHCTQSRTAYSTQRLVIQCPQSTKTRLLSAIHKPQCSSYGSQSQIFIDDQDFSLQLLHSMPHYGGSSRNIARTFGMEKLEWCGYPTVKKFGRYVYSFWQNVRAWQTDTRTDTPTLHDDIGRACIASRGN